MLPGPIQIRKCKVCKDLFKLKSNTSGFSSGARLWSDGAIHNSTLTRAPVFYKCQKCGNVGPISETDLVDSYQSYFGFFAIVDPSRFESESFKKRSVEQRYESVRMVQRPSVNEVLNYVNGMLSAVEQKKLELVLRLEAWRFGNDAWRVDSASCHRSSQEIINMHAILMLTDDVRLFERVWRVEILRELAEFDEAKQELSLCILLESNHKYLDMQAELISNRTSELKLI